MIKQLLKKMACSLLITILILSNQMSSIFSFLSSFTLKPSETSDTESESESEGYTSQKVENFMSGTSFTLSPLKRLEFIMASSIFGEPQYYRKGDEKQEGVYQKRLATELPEEYLANLLFPEIRTQKASDVAVDAIQKALNYDFKETLELAKRLRTEFNMRKNPQVIMILACLHEGRQLFNKYNPRLFRDTVKAVCTRPDDMYEQFELYKQFSGINGKSKLPGVIKRAWCDVLESIKPYQLKKYLTSAHIIDLIRLAHPDPKVNARLTELVKTGDLTVAETEQTWEQLKAQGKNWDEITNTIDIPHMALLRNLRNIFSDMSVTDDKLSQLIDKLVDGVLNGKQFPFRYYSAYKTFKPDTGHAYVKRPSIKRSKKYEDKMVKTNELFNNSEFDGRKEIILNGLEMCLQKSLDNFPKLRGDTISLCDNSGSTKGTFNSVYGSVRVSLIANLSALLTAYNTKGHGSVGVFGDRLQVYQVDKTRPILEQLDEINKIGEEIGGCTETGIWLYFKQALEGKEELKVDNLFIYSDQQCGYGTLYGSNSDEYADYIYKGSNNTWNGDRYIDVMKLVNKYRELINPKLNMFSVQIASYDNSILPENIYRCCLLSGWTGSETAFAKEIIRLWDEIEDKESEQFIL